MSRWESLSPPPYRWRSESSLQRLDAPQAVSSCTVSLGMLDKESMPKLVSEYPSDVNIERDDCRFDWEVVIENTFLTCVRKSDPIERRPSSAPADIERSASVCQDIGWQSLAFGELPIGQPCADELPFFCEGSPPSDDSTATCCSRDEVAVLREELANMQKRCAELEAQVASSRAANITSSSSSAGADPDPVIDRSSHSCADAVPVSFESSAPIAPGHDAADAAVPGAMHLNEEACAVDAEMQDVPRCSEDPAVKGSGISECEVAELEAAQTSGSPSKTAKRNQRRRANARMSRAESDGKPSPPANANASGAAKPKAHPSARVCASDTGPCVAKASVVPKASTTAKAHPPPPAGLLSSSSRGATLQKPGLSPTTPCSTDFGIMTLEQLAQFSGDSPRLLVSVSGHVFDVSSHRARYGTGGPSGWAAGKDISWALLTGERTAENCNRFYNAAKAPRGDRDMVATLGGWLTFFQQEYGATVGRLDVYEHEKDFPAPPDLDDQSSECSLQ